MHVNRNVPGLGIPPEFNNSNLNMNVLSAIVTVPYTNAQTPGMVVRVPVVHLQNDSNRPVALISNFFFWNLNFNWSI
jgi:hypothetical protein